MNIETHRVGLIAATSPSDPLGDPLQALAGGGVMAVIIGVEGPYYRRPGTFMAFPAAGGAVGQLTSGCIESDLALHAGEVWATGRAQRLRYGAGSPFVDLVLPCGGGLEVALIQVDPSTIEALLAARRDRRESAFVIDTGRGAISLGGAGITVPLVPPTRFLTWGTGVEAVTFAALAQAAGYGSVLTTHDAATARAADAAGVATADDPQALTPDRWTAVTLFYHDHEREPLILAKALASPAFYVGAQGSLRSHQARVAALRALGTPDEAIARLRGPIGLIPSARDPKVLAVSVLAEILAEAGR